jgi:predicted amidohydrolase
MSKIKVAAVQFPLTNNITSEKLLTKIECYLTQAQGCDLVVFPELFTTEIINLDPKISYHQQLKDHATNFTPQYITWLQAQAQIKKINILGGTVPRLVAGKIYNTALLVLSTGAVHYQDKLFLTPDEKEWHLTPGQTLNIFETSLGRLVITTCFDSEIPAVSEFLVKAQPEIILIPSWTSTPSGLNRVTWSARARAVEHYAYVVKTSTVPGPDIEDLFGQAEIIGPQDTGFATDIISGPLNQAALITGELDLHKIRYHRPHSGYYPAHEQLTRTAPLTVKKIML